MCPQTTSQPFVKDDRARLVMQRDVFGPSRCLAQFAGLGILPKSFLATCHRDCVIVDFEFDPHEDVLALNRALAKLSVLPVMCTP